MSKNEIPNREELVEKIKSLEFENSKLKREMSHLQTVFDCSPMLIWFKDDKNHILNANRMVADAANLPPEDIINKSTWDIYPDEADKYFRDDLEVISSGKPKLGIIETMQTANGKIYVQTDKVPWRDESGKVKGVIVFVSDITVRRRYEEEVYKSQKLKSLGVLAGGLAHDLNNLLGGITGNIDLATRSIEDGLDGSLYLQRLRPVLDKAKHLTQQLLTFSQGGAPVKMTVSIESLVGECIDFFSAGSNVECQLTTKSNLHNVDIDVNQMSQVITNLILNAQQAMPDGGKIDISLENVILNTYKKAIGTNLNGDFIKITIKDFGRGIPNEIMDNIFDPFFTTKETGTGLGLSISHSIIQRHGGNIDVKQNQFEDGVTVSVYLPASFSKPMQITKESVTAEDLNFKVLVMDDEPYIRELMSDMLSELHCTYNCVSDGKEAIKAFQSAIEENEPYDVVILDLTIHGGLGGKETVKNLRKIGKHFKALVSSGYSNDPVLSSPKDFGFDAVLKKPFGLNDLRVALSEFVKIRPKLVSIKNFQPDSAYGTK